MGGDDYLAVGVDGGVGVFGCGGVGVGVGFFAAVFVYEDEIAFYHFIAVQAPALAGGEVPDARLVGVDVHQAEVAGDHLEGSDEVVFGPAQVADEVHFCGEFAGEFVQGFVAFAGRLEVVDCLGAGLVV